jgi:hypothetical protein
VAWVPENANVLTLTSGDGSVREEKASEAFRTHSWAAKVNAISLFCAVTHSLLVSEDGWF